MGGRGSPQDLRHRRILEGQARVNAAAAAVEDAPDRLKATLGAKENADLPAACRNHAQGRLGEVVLDKVRRSFLGASVAHPRSRLRSERMDRLRTDLVWADDFHSSMSSQGRDGLQRFREDAKAMDAVARSQALRQEAAACAQDEAQGDEQPVVRSPSRGGGGGGGASLDASASSDRHAACAERRGRIVGEAMEMLRQWKRHSEVTKELVGALLSMAETGGDEFKQEMDRRGLGVLASTVADVWSGRPEVARSALRLLGVVSIELLIAHIDETIGDGTIVCLGLEALNKLTRSDPSAVDEVAEHGGREMLDEVDNRWSSDRMVALQSLNLRRRLRKSKAKSLKPRKQVELPPDDVVRIRGCFDAIDEDESGYIDAEELAVAFQLMGIKANRAELLEAMAEVDVDGSGKVEWPEFLYLMSRFGTGQSIEAQFTQDRLAELREVFSLFDADGNGSLDCKELSMVMRSVGLSPTESEIRAMINEVDADESGCIEFPEFLFLMSRKVPDPENQHRLAFEFFDQEKDGFIKRDSFIKQMRELSSEFSVEDLEEMIFEAKFENGDLDMLTYREFVKMMMRS